MKSASYAMNGLWYDTVVDAHPATFLCEKSAGFKFLQMMAHRGFREIDDGRQYAGTRFKILLAKQVGE